MYGEDEGPLQHQGWIHDDWRDGATCADCEERAAEMRARHSGGSKTIHWNVSRLAADREGHYTQNELAQSVITQAKEEGREIQRARTGGHA